MPCPSEAPAQSTGAVVSWKQGEQPALGCWRERAETWRILGRGLAAPRGGCRAQVTVGVRSGRPCKAVNVRRLFGRRWLRNWDGREGRRPRELVRGGCCRKGVWSLVLRGSLGYRAEQAAELATQGARGLASLAEGRSGRRNVDFLEAGPPHAAAGCPLLRKSCG